MPTSPPGQHRVVRRASPLRRGGKSLVRPAPGHLPVFQRRHGLSRRSRSAGSKGFHPRGCKGRARPARPARCNRILRSAVYARPRLAPATRSGFTGHVPCANSGGSPAPLGFLCPPLTYLRVRPPMLCQRTAEQRKNQFGGFGGSLGPHRLLPPEAAIQPYPTPDLSMSSLPAMDCRPRR
jgi:hypothetical protein